MWYDSVNDEMVNEFTSPGEVEIRVADAALITANRSVLKIVHKDMQVIEITLKLWLDRSQVYRATKKTNFFGLTPQQLLDFDPNLPLICNAKGKDNLKMLFEEGLKAGSDEAETVTRVGKDGFPAFFDLDNYTLESIHQEKVGK